MTAGATSPGYYRDLIQVLVSKEFKIRYKSTALGYVWSLLHPLAFALVFWFLFKQIVGLREPNYGMFLVMGLFPWQWFSNSLIASNYHFLSNASLIKKVSFPRGALVLSGALNDLIHFLVAIPVIVGFMIFNDFYPSFSWLWLLPMMVLVQFGIAYGLSMFLATVNLFFRDLERLTTIGTLMWFYMTPVLYPPQLLQDKGYEWLLWTNPMALVITSWRAMFQTGAVPWDMVGIAALWSVGFLGIGLFTFRKLQWRFAEVV